MKLVTGEGEPPPPQVENVAYIPFEFLEKIAYILFKFVFPPSLSLFAPDGSLILTHV